VNVPLPPGATGDVVRRAIDEVAAPVIDDFSPTWVLVSAGFDAHREDPMADFHLTSGDFAQLAGTVAGFCPRPGRLAMFLEGGYNVEALRSSVHATLSAVLGNAHEPEAPSSGGPGTEQVARVAKARHDTIAMLRDSDEAEVAP
jgi:acetoin utilization deacetylase AcuC-like enzyme